MKLKRHQVTSDNKFSGMIGLVCGMFLLAGGIWVGQVNRYEQQTMRETQGVVVDSVSRRERDTSSNQDKLTYAPVIEFQVLGQPIRFVGWYESYRLSNGHTVLVRYDTDDPVTTAKVVNPLENLVPWVTMGMGGFAIAYSLGTLAPWRFFTK